MVREHGSYMLHGQKTKTENRKNIIKNSIKTLNIKRLVLYYNLEEWDRVGVEERFKRRGHMYAYACFLLMYGRNQYNIVKKLSSN